MSSYVNNPIGTLGYYGYFGGACDDPYSEACEDEHCPSVFSKAPCVIACTDSQKRCHKYLADKESGSLTTVSQFQRAERINADVTAALQARAAAREEVARADAARQRAEAALAAREAETRRQQEELDAAKGTTKKVVIGFAAVTVLALAGTLFLSKKKKRRRR